MDQATLAHCAMKGASIPADDFRADGCSCTMHRLCLPAIAVRVQGCSYCGALKRAFHAALCFVTAGDRRQVLNLWLELQVTLCQIFADS